MKPPKYTVLFDGGCNLCNRAVVFIIRRDRRAQFAFASLESGHARNILQQTGMDQEPNETMYLVEEGRVYDRSTAALRIARRLGGGWPLLYGFIVLPRGLRDSLYRWIARNRIRWFGRRESCMVPAPEWKERFFE